MTKEHYLKLIEPTYTGYQELHVHSQGSYKDAVLAVEEIFDWAEKLGRNAVSITDHGSMTRLFMGLKERTIREKKHLEEELKLQGVNEEEIQNCLSAIGAFDSIRNPSEKMMMFVDKYTDAFVNAVKKSVQFIPGVEMYATDGGDDTKARHHLILYATDWQGVKSLFKIYNMAQTLQYKGCPQVTFESLERFAGEGTEGHGKIIATSACAGGHISKILLRPQKIDALIEKNRKKQSSLEIVPLKRIEEAKTMLSERETELKLLRTVKNETQKTAKKDFTARIQKEKEKIQNFEQAILEEDNVTKRTKLEEKLEKSRVLLTQYEEGKQEAEKAKNEFARLSKQVDEYVVVIKKLKEQISNYEKKNAPYLKLDLKNKELEAEKEKLGDVYALAKETALRYQSIFGKGNYYIELQNHGIPEELYCQPYLVQIAKETGMPMTVANDVHYATLKDKRIRDLVTAMRFPGKDFSEIENEIGHDQLYFKTNEQMEALFADYPEAIANTSEIAKRCNVFYKREMHLPEFDTECDLTPGEYLEKISRDNIPIKYPEFNTHSIEWKEEFEKRLTYELGIIDTMGFNSYICIVQDFIAYARQKGGHEAVGPGRGSGAGSLVCYLANITDIDPLRYGLLFERFLNPDRVSMPKIYWASNVNFTQRCA